MNIQGKENILYTTDRPDVVFTSGQGSWLEGSDGNTYLDFVQGWAVNCLGHCPAELNTALAEQAGQLWNPGPAYYNQPQLALAEKLAGATRLQRSFFVSSGAEANESAIKLARKWGGIHKNGAYKIITMDGGFHGRSLATMSACGKKSFEPLFNPKVEGFIKVPFNDLAACTAAIDEGVVAIMLEPIQGEAGVLPADKAFIQGLADLCREQEILLIFDEVQTGMARTGKMFAAQRYGVTPDIMTLGKGLGGGAPLAAMLAKEEICCFVAGDQGGTFSGNALMSAIGLAVFNTVSSPDFLRAIDDKSDYLRKTLESIFGQGSVRGAGLLLAVNLQHPMARELTQACFEQGLLINAPHEHCLRLMPALNVSLADIDRLRDKLLLAMDKCPSDQPQGPR